MKKIFIVVLFLCMVLGLCSCSEKNTQDKKNEIAMIKIEGEKYDLNGEFQQVIGAMIENGLHVIDGYDFKNDYDKEGEYIKCEHEDISDHIVAQKEVTELKAENGSLLYNTFSIRGNNLAFETEIGITSESDEDDIMNLEGFIKSSITLKSVKHSYLGIYVDGELIDFAEYEDDYAEWVNLVEKEGYMAGKEMIAQMDPFRPGYHGGLIQNLELNETKDITVLENEHEQKRIPLKETILYRFAVRDLGLKLKAGDITSYIIVEIEYTEKNNVNIIYSKFMYVEDKIVNN